MKKILPLILLLILLAGALYGINRDLYHYEYAYPFSRVLTPEETGKGNYLFTEPVPVKAGTYRLAFDGQAEKAGCGCIITDAADTVIYSGEIRPGSDTHEFTVVIPAGTSVRIGFAYDPAAGTLEAGNIRLSSDTVLYKDSVLRHGLLSGIVLLVFSYIVLRLYLPKFSAGTNIAHNERVFLFLLLLTLLSVWPFFDASRCTEGDDFYFHLTRIEGMAQTLKAGYFPTRIYLGWMQNYGVGSGFYYPDLLMILPAAMRMLGFSLITCLKTFLILCTFFSALTTYIAAKRIGNGRTSAGLFAAALYTFAAYRLICVFYRNALGEVQAFIFFPLVILGLFEILNGNTGKWPVFAAGFFGLLMSHLISLAIAGVLCALYLLFSLRRLIKEPRIIAALVQAALLTLCIGAFFLLPMLEQNARNELEINWFLNLPSAINRFNMTEFVNLFLPYDAWEHNGAAADVSYDHPYPGWALLAVLLLAAICFLQKRRSDELRPAYRMALFAVPVLVMATDLFPWMLFKWFLMRIQFSWRILAAASALLSVSGGILLREVLQGVRDRRLRVTIGLLIAVLSGLPIPIHTFRTKLVGNEKLVLQNKQVSGAEYMPHGFNVPFAYKNGDTVLPDPEDARVVSHKRRGLSFSFGFEKDDDTETAYSVPLIYYYGYTAVLSDDAGDPVPVPVGKDERGLVRVSDAGLRRGSIRVSYEKTTVQRVSEWISLAGIAGAALIVLRRRRTIVTGRRK